MSGLKFSLSQFWHFRCTKKLNLCGKQKFCCWFYIYKNFVVDPILKSMADDSSNPFFLEKDPENII